MSEDLYKQPDYVTKRLRYFDGQFLSVTDFLDEQKYHIDRQRRLARFLHISGVLDGLVVEKEGSGIKINPGTAIDQQGRQILVSKVITIAENDIKTSSGVALAQNQSLFLVLTYAEIKIDEQQEVGAKDFTRFEEKAEVTWMTDNDAKNAEGVQIAKVTKNASGAISVDLSVCQYSGLKVMGNVGIGTLSPTAKLEVVQDGTGSVAYFEGSEKTTSDALYVEQKGTGRAAYFKCGANTKNAALRVEQNGTGTGLYVEQNGTAVAAYFKCGANTTNAGLYVEQNGTANAAYFQGNAKTTSAALLVVQNGTGNAAYFKGGSGVKIEGSLEVIGTTNLNPSLTANANNVTLTALNISPSFQENGKTGVKKYGLIVGSGNVGIGTTNPTEKLEVNGTIRATSLTLTGNLTIPSGSSAIDVGNTLASKASKNGAASEDFNAKDLTVAGALTVSQIKAQALTISSGVQITGNLNVDGDIYIGKNLPVNRNSGVGKILRFGSDIDNSDPIYMCRAFLDYDSNALRMCLADNSSPKAFLEIGNGGINGEGWTKTCTISASGNIEHKGTIQSNKATLSSDIRIKEIKNFTNRQEDLQTLLKIEIVDYTYKDTFAYENQLYKKVIGQQIAQVFPLAVSTITDVVPDIFKPAYISNGWINLPEHDLKVGEMVKIIIEGKATDMLTIEAIELDSFKVALDHKGDVFVYGREVDDFHVVDYDALSMLNISATQELYRIIEILQTEVQQLKSQLH